jgi:hypothetical protein
MSGFQPSSVSTANVAPEIRKFAIFIKVGVVIRRKNVFLKLHNVATIAAEINLKKDERYL